MKSVLVIVAMLGIFLQVNANSKRLSKGQPYFNIDHVSIRLSPTALVSYDNLNNSSASGGRKNWGVVTTSFTPRRGSSKSSSVWYDNVTMEGVLIMATDSKESSVSHVLFSGNTKFMTIEGDGKSHRAVFYVPPQLLRRYYDGNRSFKVGMFVAARVIFYGPDKTIYGEGYWVDGAFVKNKKESAKVRKLMTRFDGNLSGVQKVVGGLFSKNQTPWANLDYCSYDLISINNSELDSAKE